VNATSGGEMTGSAIEGRITPGLAEAQLGTAEGTDKNMCRITCWFALFSAAISHYHSLR